MTFTECQKERKEWKMNIKKKVSLLLAVLLLTATATACGGEDAPTGDSQGESGSESRTAWMSPETDHKAETKPETEDEIETNRPEEGTETETETEQEQEVATIPEVYSKYNVKYIATFENGVAAFYVPKDSRNDFLLGYIDVEGKVLVDAVYESYGAPLINFAYNYTRVRTTNDDRYRVYRIIDRQGNVIFEERENNVTNIGEVSQGYFWVMTKEETLAGNIYTMRYYSAVDLSVVATFEDAKNYSSYSSVSESGNATIDKGGKKFTFNIADYDSNFTPTLDTWTLDVSKVESFAVARSCEYNVSNDAGGAGQVATVVLQSKDDVCYYAIVDGAGNVLMEPQRNVEFPYGVYIGWEEGKNIETYTFSKGLCPARDAASGKWGYIDTQGNWKIQPQYASALYFSCDGYATVNDKIVIDTNGNIVLSPSAPKTGLSGKYCWRDGTGDKHYLTFTTDGQINYKRPYFAEDKVGHYQTQGASLTISEMGTIYVAAIKGDGTYSFRLDGNKLYIDDTEWKLVEE